MAMCDFGIAPLERVDKHQADLFRVLQVHHLFPLCAIPHIISNNHMFEIICFDMFLSSNCSSENIWSIFIHLYLLDVHNHSQPIFTHAYPFFKGVSHDALNGVPGHFWAQCSTLSWPMRISYSWEYVKLINLHTISGISYDFIWFHGISRGQCHWIYSSVQRCAGGATAMAGPPSSHVTNVPWAPPAGHGQISGAFHHKEIYWDLRNKHGDVFMAIIQWNSYIIYI